MKKNIQINICTISLNFIREFVSITKVKRQIKFMDKLRKKTLNIRIQYFNGQHLYGI